jgi:glutamyl-tRNA synthetase
MNVVKEHGVETTLEHLQEIVALMKGRVNFVHELWDSSSFYFEAPVAYDEKTAKKRWKEDSAQKMTELADLLESLDDFSIDNQDKAVHEWIEAKGYGMGEIMNAFRLALVGEGKGPQMFHISGLIGKEETLSRLRRAITVLG